MVNETIRSNAFRGEYMQQIKDRTIDEIHDDMVTIFGPYATDAYILQDNLPYFTRDGLEVIRSMKFDHPLSMYILQIMYQAVYDQGKHVGDGTTTLAVLYTNLYKAFRDSDVTIDRKQWNTFIGDFIEKIKERSEPMTDDSLKKVLLTCTQDTELSEKIYTNLKDAILEQAFITINKSNIQTDFQMTVHNSPIFEATKQFSVRPVASTEENCSILYCNGVLDIAHPETLTSIMSRIVGEVPKLIVILAHGINEHTRQTVKELNRLLHINSQSDPEFNIHAYNNIAIYTLDKYRSYSSEQLEDIATVITDEYGIGGLVNNLTFESLLYQSFGNPDIRVPDLETFDCDIHHIEKMKEIFNQSYKIEFDDIKGIRLHKSLGTIASERYHTLLKEIEEEKSEVRKIALNKRLKTMYGKFIEVEVGSRLLKDSQLKYELILDAVLSASDGAENGVLRANSLLVAIKILIENHQTYENDNCAIILRNALVLTLKELINNGWDLDITETNDYLRWIQDSDISTFDLTVDEAKDILIPNDKSDGTYDKIIEPVSIITTMLKNSTVMLELAHAKTFHLDSFQQNYIQ